MTTREEARFVLQGPLGEHFGHKIPEGVEDAWLDAWVSLGMLKLEEPRAVGERVCEALWNKTPHVSPSKILFWLDEAGLKIVEK